MLDITARMYLYRWRPVEWCRAHPSLPSFTLHALEVRARADGAAGRRRGGSARWLLLRVVSPPAARLVLGNSQRSPLPPALQCGFRAGTDKLYLRLPHELTHAIDAASPLAAWREQGGLSEDADSEIVVVVS